MKLEIQNAASQPPPTPKQGIRHDIQGLRCLAILGVLLFHLWPSRVRNGAFGVDIFFVISGYLMKHLSSRRDTVDLSFTTDFYCRRIKRLLPLYLIALILTLIAAIILMEHDDVQKAVQDVLFAGTFVSNTYGIPKAGYFHTSNDYPLYLHTWSLSTEMQFYLICPLILLLEHRLNAIRSKTGTVLTSVLLVSSCCLQIAFRDAENFSHMALPCRLWQFLVGFWAHDLHRRRFSADFWSSALALLLALSLATSPTGSVELDRLLITVAALGLVGVGGAAPLEAETAVWLGDCSYGVYILHWPLLVLHKYRFLAEYVPDVGPRWGDGFSLGCLAVLLGWGLERLATAATSRFVDGGRRLFCMAALLYAVLGAVVMSGTFMPRNEEHIKGLFWIPDGPRPLVFYNYTIFDKSAQLYELHGKNLSWTKSEVEKWNEAVLNIENDKWNCLSGNTTLPTSFDMSNSTEAFKLLCTIEGDGDLEIVIVGNSWARDLFYGVYYHLRHRFKRLSLVATRGCQFFTIAFEKKFEFIIPRCEKVMREFPLIMKGWQHKIDVIVFHMNWVTLPYMTFQQDDIHQVRLQKFIDDLADLNPRVIMTLVGQVNYTALGEEYKAKLKKERYITLPYSGYLIPRRRMAAVNCSVCETYTTEPAYCSFLSDTCHFTDTEGRGIFTDGQHTTPLGAYHLAAAFTEAFHRWERLQTTKRQRSIN